MLKRKGNATIIFENAPVIYEMSSVTGPKEGEGPLGKLFDEVWEDPMLGKSKWEEAESELQKKAVEKVLEKAVLNASDLDCLFAGDLLGQIIATSFGIATFNRPLFGLYGACSTIGEALMLSAIQVDGGFAENVLALTSSHFASAERQFRFPSEYGNQRPLSATWTVTGSAAFIVKRPMCAASEKMREQLKHKARITSATPGKIVDYGVRDSMNMGACMAPAACDTIYNHLKDMDEKPEDYDHIITGDLGYVGHDILLDLMQQRGMDIRQQHMDCGMEIFDRATQDTHSGGSGCACSAVTLASFVLPKLASGEWKKVLFVPTGALLSPISFNEGKSVPGVAHAVVIEAPGK